MCSASVTTGEQRGPVMEAAERQLFDATVRRAVESHRGAGLDAALHEVGWREALADDPQLAVAVLFEHQGRAHAASGALDDVVADALGLAAGPGAAVVLPALGDAAPPGSHHGRLEVDGLGTHRLARAETALVVVGGGAGPSVVETKAAELRRRPVSGMDAAMGLVAVSGHPTATVSPSGLGPDRWELAVGRARLAIGHELVGASAAMLELARAHALDRRQFGRPIAAFQAVRHRLAETHVAIEAASAMLDGAWLDGDSASAAMAKAVAGRSARTCARHCQQVLAGMGFTAEHPLHHYVRRVLVLDELFGSARSLTAELGRRVLAERRLPPRLPL
jgi:acyl-CoA dehydrogenase-like protein